MSQPLRDSSAEPSAWSPEPPSASPSPSSASSSPNEPLVLRLPAGTSDTVYNRLAVGLGWMVRRYGVNPAVSMMLKAYLGKLRGISSSDLRAQVEVLHSVSHFVLGSPDRGDA